MHDTIIFASGRILRTRGGTQHNRTSEEHGQRSGEKWGTCCGPNFSDSNVTSNPIAQDEPGVLLDSSGTPHNSGKAEKTDGNSRSDIRPI
jgi:hypothetical protein